MTYVVAALYKFVPLPSFRELRRELLKCCKQENIEGTLLLAEEGINGTIAGGRANIDRTLTFLRQHEELRDLDHKESFASERPFYRLKIKLRKEIVTMRVEGVSPTERVGEYVEPEHWNELITREDVITIDTRNDFEVRVGHFEGAIDPQTQTFSDFPAFVQQKLGEQRHKTIAMYCTGGIRCERATSYLLRQGFEQVYHLKGGILRYLERIPPKQSLWHGECFVFDQRVSLKHGLEEGSFELCYGCQSPLSPQDRKSPDFEPGVSCSFCIEQMSEARRRALRERAHQIQIARSRGEHHLGQNQEQMRAKRLLKRKKHMVQGAAPPNCKR